jgi:hypothetical protein
LNADKIVKNGIFTWTFFHYYLAILGVTVRLEYLFT